MNKIFRQHMGDEVSIIFLESQKIGGPCLPTTNSRGLNVVVTSNVPSKLCACAHRLWDKRTQENLERT